MISRSERAERERAALAPFRGPPYESFADTAARYPAALEPDGVDRFDEVVADPRHCFDIPGGVRLLVWRSGGWLALFGAMPMYSAPETVVADACDRVGTADPPDRATRQAFAAICPDGSALVAEPDYSGAGSGVLLYRIVQPYANPSSR